MVTWDTYGYDSFIAVHRVPFDLELHRPGRICMVTNHLSIYFTLPRELPHSNLAVGALC